MKAAYNQSVALPSHYVDEKPRHQVKVITLIERLDMFFGLESRGDRVWFYGFYGISLTILLFIFVVTQMMTL